MMQGSISFGHRSLDQRSFVLLILSIPLTEPHRLQIQCIVMYVYDVLLAQYVQETRSKDNIMQRFEPQIRLNLRNG